MNQDLDRTWEEFGCWIEKAVPPNLFESLFSFLGLELG